MFVGLALGPTRPLLLMISGRAYIRTVNQNIILTIGPTALPGDLEFFSELLFDCVQNIFLKNFYLSRNHSLRRVSMGLTDRRKTAKNLVDSRKN